jgi:hypothetical protein
MRSVAFVVLDTALSLVCCVAQKNDGPILD